MDHPLRLLGFTSTCQAPCFAVAPPPLHIRVDRLGREAIGGHQTLWIEASDLAVRIAMTGGINSLNANMTAGVLLYEAVRQRRVPEVK